MSQQRASYTNPHTRTELGGPEEKVVKVEGTTVYTQVGTRRMSYYEVTAPNLIEGDMVRQKIQCRSASMRIAWSPFDDVEDD